MNVIELANVSKRYRRTATGGPRTLRDLGLQKRIEHWALRDVTLGVRAGESVGLIGLNGSGKSTLLRVIARTTVPTSGTVRNTGVIGGLLALGSGLDASLSAEENAFTGAILAGIPRSEIRSLLPSIAAFAELEDVFHEPMRTFSDGMKLRLAFATAVHVKPQILLIDEVLAVGDAGFKAKCLARLASMRDEGMTFIVVSHAMSQIEQLCERTVWIDHGRVRLAGPTEEVLARYEESLASEQSDRARSRDERRFGTGNVLAIQRIETTRPSAPTISITSLRSGQPLTVRLALRQTGSIANMTVGVNASIHRGSDYNRPIEIQTSVRIDKSHVEVCLDLERLDLAEGEYWVNGGVYSDNWTECYDYVWQAARFQIDGPEATGPLVPPHKWTIESTDSPTVVDPTTPSKEVRTIDENTE